MGGWCLCSTHSGPDAVLLAVESARDAQRPLRRGGCRADPAEGKAPDSWRLRDHALGLPLSLDPQAHEELQGGGSRGHIRLPPPGAGSPAGPFGPRVLHCEGGSCWSPQRGLRLEVVCVSVRVCAAMRVPVWQGVCVCVWRVCLWGVDLGSSLPVSALCSTYTESPTYKRSSEPSAFVSRIDHKSNKVSPGTQPYDRLYSTIL